jgi:hypothetical protein
MKGGQNRPEHTHTHTEQYRADRTNRESSLQLKRTQQEDTEDFILCGAVAATFRVLSLFVLMTCYNDSKTESVTTDCSDDLLGISNKSINSSDSTFSHSNM